MSAADSQALSELTDGDIDLLRSKPSQFVEVVLDGSPFDYQREVLDTESDRIAFVSGRQVGKSVTASWYALHFVLTNPGTTVLITAPTQRQSGELFDKIKREINGSNIPGDLWGIERETRTIMEFTNDSRVICLPAGEDGSNIRGYTADLIVVDEAAFIPDEVFFQALLPMMATTEGTMLLLSTPFGSSGFLYDAFHNDLEEQYFTKRVATYRNPTVSDEYISNQQRQLSSIDFKQEILGQFVESASSFFTAEVIDQAMSLSTRRDSRYCYLGVDPARHGEDRSVFISIDGNGNVFSIESETDSAITESIGRVMYLHDQFNYRKICIDETSLGGGVVDVLKADMTGRVVEGVTFSSKSKPDMYNTLKANLEQGEISLPDHAELRKELLDLEFEFTTSKRMKIVPPDGGHDDFCFVAGTEISTPNGRTPIEELERGDLVLTRHGYKPVTGTGNRRAQVISRFGLTGTPDHPIITPDNVQRFDSVKASELQYAWQLQPMSSSTTATSTDGTPSLNTATSEFTTGGIPKTKLLQSPSTGKSGKTKTERYQTDTSYTTETEIPSTTKSTTSKPSREASTSPSTCSQTSAKSSLGTTSIKRARQQQNGTALKREGNGIWSTTKTLAKNCTESDIPMSATIADRNTRLTGKNEPGSVTANASRNNTRKKTKNFESVKNARTNSRFTNTQSGKTATTAARDTETVYNISVADQNEYFANGILVHNCDSLALASYAYDKGGAPRMKGSASMGDEVAPETTGLNSR